MLLRFMQIMVTSSSSSTFPPVYLTNQLKSHPYLHLHHRLYIFSIPFPTTSLQNSRFFSNFPLLSTRKSIHRFRPFRMSSTRSESNSSAPSSPDLSVSSGNVRKVNFCQWCGGRTKHEIPNGEDKMRAICTVCENIAYQNPKMVVGCLVEHENKILLCKRNIQPSHGRWTLPAGYMEIGESAAEGAIRETQEEAGAEVEVLSPFAQLDIPLIGQTYIIFLAKLKKPHFSPGPESMECRLFSFDEIPFDYLAFSSIVVALKLYVEDMSTGRTRFHYGTINKRPGSGPDDIHAFSFEHHLLS